MKSFPSRRIPAAAVILALSLSYNNIARPEPAKATVDGHQAEAILPGGPAHDYYTRLAKLSAEASGPNLPIDAQRYPTSKDLVKEILSHRPFYLNVPLDTFGILPPPANSSAQTRAELDYLLRLQEQRTLIEIAYNLDFQNWGYVVTAQPKDRDFFELRENFFRVGRSIGTWFNARKLPKTADLIARVWQDTRFYMWSLKDQYSRMRPYQLEPKIKNLQETDWPAYPSGHASFAYMLGYLYSAISPAQESIFMHDAYTIAHSREIIGVHFPSDSEAGRIFAQKFVGLLLQNELFAQDLKATREEWENASREDP